jgi:predicted nucleic acid-binding protein
MWMVDSSRYIDWMRQGRSPTRILRPYVLAGQVASCGPIRVEVIRGAVKPAIRDELNLLFDAQLDVPLSDAVWRSVAELAWNLDRKGHVLPLSDLVIGACALRASATLITTDAHFARIPGLRVRSDLPAGPGN